MVWFISQLRFRSTGEVEMQRLHPRVRFHLLQANSAIQNLSQGLALAHSETKRANTPSPRATVAQNIQSA